MSVEFYAFERDVIEWDDIKRIVPDEAAAFEEKLPAAEMDMEDFCRGMCLDDWDTDGDESEETVEAVIDAWNKLEEAFTRATTIEGAGLELEVEYHDPDYDEHPVGFFSVEGVRQLTPAGARYEDVIQRRQFTGIG
jgi:hypothetical protein